MGPLVKILTFAHGPFLESQNRFKQELNISEQTIPIYYTSDDLDDEFKDHNKSILKYKKGYGFCIWKPYIVLKELIKLKDNEVLLYVDCADKLKDVFIPTLKSYFLNPQNTSLFVNRGYNNGIWTKRDTFVLMDCDSEKYYSSVQLEAGLFALLKTNYNIDLIKQWLQYCMDPDILIDKPNICGKPNLPGYIEHRYDQSVLTNIIIKENIKHYNTFNNLVDYSYYQPQNY